MKTKWWLVLIIVFLVAGMVNLGRIYEQSKNDNVWIFHIFGVDIFTYIATPVLLLIAAVYCLHAYSNLRQEAAKKKERI